MTGYISLTPPLGTRSPSDRDMSRICCFTVQVPNRLTVAHFRLAPIRRLPYDQTQLEAMLEAIQALWSAISPHPYSDVRYIHFHSWVKFCLLCVDASDEGQCFIFFHPLHVSFCGGQVAVHLRSIFSW